MPPSSVAARSLALAVIGVGTASFAAHGQNVTAFNPYSGTGRPGAPLPQYAAPPAAPTVDAVGPGPVAGPAFNPWSSRTPAMASRQSAPPQTRAPAAPPKARASLPPPPPGPIKSRVVAVPELTTSRSKPRDARKASPAEVAPATVHLAPAPKAPVTATPAPAAPPAPVATPAAPPPVVTIATPPSVRPAPAPSPAPTAPVLAAPPPVPAPPAVAAPPPQPPATAQRQMAAVAPAPSPPPVPTARSNVAATLVFTARSTELSDTSRTELDRLARDITERTPRQVELRTIADSRDPDSRKISLARALIVRNYLIGKGVRSKIEIASIVGDGAERVEILVPST